MMLFTTAQELLDQLARIISGCKEKDYLKPLQELSEATIGQHVRHILEFFLCLLDAETTGAINYDNRKRDQFIERNTKLALSTITSIQEWLSHDKADFPVSIEANYTLEDRASQKMGSSFHRELAYNIEHAIHHMALIKIAIKCSLNYIELPKNFGVASSTIRYQMSSDA